jgi:hypothetical protein
MIKNKKGWLLVALAVWTLAEVGHSAYVTHSYHFRGRPYWPYYAYERNRSAIRRLYRLTTPGRTQRAFLEAREGRLADSTGHLSTTTRALVQQLAHDIAPAGYFYFSVNPVRHQDSPLFVTGPCPSHLPECSCMDELPPAVGGGILFNLSCSGPEPRHTPTELEYVRVGNVALQTALQQRSCYAPLGPDEFLGTQGLPAGIPLRYSEYQRDFLVSKVLRAIKLL